MCSVCDDTQGIPSGRRKTLSPVMRWVEDGCQWLRLDDGTKKDGGADCLAGIWKGRGAIFRSFGSGFEKRQWAIVICQRGGKNAGRERGCELCSWLDADLTKMMKRHGLLDLLKAMVAAKFADQGWTRSGNAERGDLVTDLREQ